MSNTDAFAKKMKDEELKVMLDAYRESVAGVKHYKARLLELGVDVDAKKEKKKKKKKQPKPAKPCRNGGLRLKDLDPAMTPIERTNLRHARDWLYKVLEDISVTKAELNKLGEEDATLGDAISLANIISINRVIFAMQSASQILRDLSKSFKRLRSCLAVCSD